MSAPTYEEFAEWVRDALTRLYDSSHLDVHPLTAEMVDVETSDLPSSQRVREIIIDAIRSMRPESSAPAHSPDWRAYRIMELRYLDGLRPSEVMDEVALGRSRYFQEQARILDALTRRLWDRRPDRPQTAPEYLVEESRGKLAYHEAERLKARATWETLDLGQAVEDLRSVIDAMVKPNVQPDEVTVTLDPARNAAVRADRVMLRQVLLNLLSHALETLPGTGQLEVAVSGSTVEVHLELSGPVSRAGTAASRQPVELHVCHQLMEAMGGSLELQSKGRSWMARLKWPQAHERILLVIDDNRDFVELFRRYLSDQGWRVVGAMDGAEARKVIADLHPTAITLDVMMPKEDGWEILRSLQADSNTSSIPVIVCSVLSEPHLATALGASDYLAKPVSQVALRQALARWH